MENVMMLFSHCIIVKGSARSAICDLQRNNVHLIPHTLADLFVAGRYLLPAKTAQELEAESTGVFNEYLSFLLERELVFYGTPDDLECFPQLSEKWLFPAHISHCILDGPAVCSYFNASFLNQLEALCCNFIQFRFFEIVSFTALNNLLELIDPSQIKSVEILLPYNRSDTVFHEKARDLVAAYRKISHLTITGADKKELYQEGSYGMGYIFKTNERIDSRLHCGIISDRLFSVNIPTYTESLHHNTCLNHKISIDTEGNIKNCPSIQESYGNISDTTLEEALNKPGFKKYWNISKDRISVCKDCEFRHVCTDCRAYLEHPEDAYSKPLKCGYNPYTCTWEEWSTHPMKQKAIDHYGIRNTI